MLFNIFQIYTIYIFCYQSVIYFTSTIRFFVSILHSHRKQKHTTHTIFLMHCIALPQVIAENQCFASEQKLHRAFSGLLQQTQFVHKFCYLYLLLFVFYVYMCLCEVKKRFVYLSIIRPLSRGPSYRTGSGSWSPFKKLSAPTAVNSHDQVTINKYSNKIEILT